MSEFSNTASLPLERKIFAKLDNSCRAEDVNAPKTTNFFKNSRGERMHFKYFVPNNDLAAGSMKHFYVYIHGLDAHINRPAIDVYGEQLSNAGIGLFLFDQVGHGYSDGLRAHIRHYSYLLDDATTFLRHILVDDPTIAAVTKGTPFSVVGQSMGGTVAAALGMLISGEASGCSGIGDFSDESAVAFLRSLKPSFSGNVLLCPALSIDALPPYAVLLLLDYLVVPLFPSHEIPSFLASTKPKEFAWNDPRYIKYIRSDGFPTNPKGLCSDGAIRFATAQSILNLVQAVLACAVTTHFPFIVLHDPEDHVCSVRGSEQLVSLNQNSSVEHELIKLSGGLHDLLTNKIDFICPLLIDRASK